jgi:Steigviridae DNA polymerase I
MAIYTIGCLEYEGIESSSMEECIEYCSTKQLLGLDIETAYKFPKNTFPNESVYKPGLDPYLSKIVMLQIGDLERIFVIDLRTTSITPLLPVLNDKKRLFVGVNLKFEAKHLSHNYGVVLHNIWDAMLVDINLTNGLGFSKDNRGGFRYSLLAMAERYLGIKNNEEIDLFNQKEEDEQYIDKTIRLGFLHIGDKPFSREQVTYGSGDIEYPIKIREIQLKGRDGYNPTFLHGLENKFCLVLADIENKGISFSPEQWLKVAEQSQIVYEKRLNTLNEYIIRKYPKFLSPPDLFGTPAYCTIQWSSSDQVIELFKHIGKCPKEKSKQTKRMEYTVGAKALNKFLNSEYKELYMNNIESAGINSFEDMVLWYMLLKKSEQAITTFGKDWLQYIHPITKRVHTSFQQILNTGRISSNNPNVQNIPQEKEYRMSFIAPKGYKIINCDFSSQESRNLAEICGDPDMLSFFNDGHPIFGDDYHSFIGTKMFQVIRRDPSLIITKDTYPKERQDAKTINFKVAYGGSAYTLKDDFGVDEDVAQEFIDGYFEAIPSLKAYFDRVTEFTEKHGYIEIDSITGRRWYSAKWYKLKELYNKAMSLYPKGYVYLPREEKEKVKDKLKITNPELKGLWSEYFALKGKLGRNSQNYPIQGLAGSQTKMAGIKFREYQIEHGLRDKLYLTSLIHDESLGECIEEFAEEGKKIIAMCMKEGASMFCKRVQMKAEAVIADFWYH